MNSKGKGKLASRRSLDREIERKRTISRVDSFHAHADVIVPNAGDGGLCGNDGVCNLSKSERREAKRDGEEREEGTCCTHGASN
jgi:hypothetical protein